MARNPGRLSALFYRSLIRLLPRSFRQQYGDRMASDFARLSGHARERGVGTVLVLHARATWDLLKIAARERRAKRADRRATVFDTLVQDVRYALRTLRAAPGFTAVAVLALGVGIGASTAIFGVIDAALLRPLPYDDSGALVSLWESDSTSPESGRNTPAVGNFAGWRSRSRSLVGLAAYAAGSVNLTGDGEPERLNGQRVTADLFSVLSVDAAVGRTFTAAEDVPGGAPVILLSHKLWQRRFAAAPAIVGDTIIVDGAPSTVVGVMPASFEFPDRDTDFWVPIRFTTEELQDRRSHYLRVVGRLAPDTDVAAARSELDAIAAQLHADGGGDNADHGVGIGLLQDDMVGDTRPILMLVIAAVGCVLLIACANVANLMLARASARAGEIAVRRALGAGRGRIVRQLLTESAVLAMVGGVVGLALAFWGVDMLALLLPAELPAAGRVGIDARVAGFALLVSLTTAVLSGSAPALHASHPDFGGGLKESGGRGGHSAAAQRFRGFLAATEIALAVVLLVGASLTLRSFVNLVGKNPGLSPANVLTVRLETTSAEYDQPGARPRFYQDVRDRTQAIPGVRSAAFVTFVPMTFAGGSTSVLAEGREESDPRERVYPVFRVVGPAYYETLQIRVRGRAFGAADRAGSEPVAVINEALAEAFWPGEDPIGRRARFSGTWFRVVGVADDVRQFELEAEPRPEFNISYLQFEDWAFFMPRDLVIRAAVEPLSLIGQVREAVRAVDPDMPISAVRTMEEIVAASTAGRRLNTLMFGGFAAAALALATLGIYGVVAFAVGQRTREIGVRMALGASIPNVLTLVLRQGFMVIGGGIVVGIGAAAMATGALRGLLYEVGPLDAFTFTTVPVILAVVGLAAVVIPARRASRVDPVEALRSR